MIRSLASQWFLLSLAAVLFVGVCQHELLAPLADAIPRNAVVAGIMLLMSAPLDLTRALGAAGALRAAGIGIAVNALIAPPFAWAVSLWLPDAVALGLIVAAIAPSTLASAAVWTRRGGGNEAVALLITVVTNLGCFATLPIWAALLLAVEHEVEAPALAARLLVIVVAPIVLGQLLRRAPSLRRRFDGHRVPLGIGAQVGLLCMVFVGAVRCGELLACPAEGPQFDGATAWKLLAGSVGLHLALFAIGWQLARGCGCDRRQALPAAIGGSQKTLAVGLDVAIGFGGLAILPMIVYHAAQLLVDSLLADWLGPRRREQEGPPPP